MRNKLAEQPPRLDWKRRVYVFGGLAGSVLGVLAGYLYARAAEEEVERGGGEVRKVPTRDALTLGLALLTVIRQVAELGKPPRKK